MKLALFTNGKARITRLVMFELICGVLIMVIGQILANLPSQSWLSQQRIAIVCFVLGTVQVAIKGAEMFFSKTVSLFQNYDQKQEQDIVEVTHSTTEAAAITTTTTETKPTHENKTPLAPHT